MARAKFYQPCFYLLVVRVVLCCYVGAKTQDGELDASEDLSLLCRGECSQLHLERSSQIKALAENLNTKDASECPEHIAAAINELNELIELNKDSVCSLEATNRIQNYYKTFVAVEHDDESDDGDNGGQPTADRPELPEALRSFFLAYGFRVSETCKKNMIATLVYESEHKLTPEDHKLIGSVTDKSQLESLALNPNDFDDILLPRDISKIMEGKNSGQAASSEQPNSDGLDDVDGKIFIHVATDDMIFRLKMLCKRRFKPIYQELILPLLYLSNIGFNYKSEELERELKEIQNNDHLHHWYRIVFVCESLEGIELVEDVSDSHLTEDSGRKMVRIMSPEEAMRIKRQRQMEQVESDKSETANKFVDKLQQVEYTRSDGIRLGDEIVDRSDGNLMNLVRSFDSHKSEVDRIKAKSISRMLRLLMSNLKNGQLNVIFEGIRNGYMERTRTQNINNEIVEMIESMVDGAYNPDQSVAGSNKIVQAYREFVVFKNLKYNQVKKETYDKVAMKKGFWYLLTLCLFGIALHFVFG
jgi:hypothetical protein